MERVYTPATDRLRELHKNYGGKKSGDSEQAYFYDNTDTNHDSGCFYANTGRSGQCYRDHNYTLLSEQEFIDFMDLEPRKQLGQPHYDNTNGSLYLIAKQRGWNAYQFDIIKRIDRSLKKGQFKEDLEKTKFLIDLWLKEVHND